MISHKHKFIFTHVPKTAGTAIRVAMDGEYDQLHNPHHMSMFEIKKLLPKKTFETYFKFLFVRNPYARQVSEWEFAHKILNLYEKLDNNTQKKDLEEDYRRKLKIKKFKNFKEFCLGFNNYCGYYYRDPDTDKVLPDFIGKFENLQQDFNTVCDKIGIPRKQLPHKNKSTHKHYTEYYDDETRQIVAEKYAKDIEYFGYKFGD